MDVSIIIVNYNTKALIRNCLLSILEKTEDLDYEIIVVDNNSTDGSKEMIKNDFPDVKLIESTCNLGFGKANNKGAAIARGRYLFLLNSDTILINNAIKILAEYLDQNKSAGICGGNLYTSDLKPAGSFSQTMPGLYADFDYFFGGTFSRFKYQKNLTFNYTQKPLVVGGFISGADMMIRKEIFLKLNGFDPDFFMYYEDTELAFRVRKENLKAVSVPAAMIIHLEGASELIKETTFQRSYEAKFKYFNKTGNGNLISLLHISFKLIALQRIVIFNLLGKKQNVNYWKALLKAEKQCYQSVKKVNN